MKNIIYPLIIIPFLLLSVKVMGGYSIARFNNQWCSATFPTSYVTGSFSISETDINGTIGFVKPVKCYSTINISFGNEVYSNFEAKLYYDIIGHYITSVKRPSNGNLTMSIDFIEHVNRIYIIDISSEHYKISKKACA
jgi:hypothetical protein